jgi:hypothetical protein
MDLGQFRQKSFLIPVTAWLIFCAVYLILFSQNDRYPSLERILTQWDGQHYLSIARDGYEMFPCPNLPRYICGNIGWFPLYPLIASAVSFTGVDVRIAVLAVSWVSFLFALILFYRIVTRRAGERVALWSLIALTATPAGFYFLTAFPYSLLLLISIIAFDMMDRGAFRLLWLPVGLAAVTYPSGVVLALPVLILMITNWGSLSPKGRVHLVTALCAPILSLTIYFLYYWYKFGDFFLYVKFQGQSYYAHELAFPLVTIYRSITTLSFSDPVFLSIFFTIGCSIVFFTRRLALTWQSWLWGILLFTPTMGTTDCYYRHIIVAFPLAVCIGLSAEKGKRRFLAWGAIALGAALMWRVYLLTYMNGRLM